MSKFTLNYLYKYNRDFGKHDIYVKIFALTIPIIPTWLILNYTKWSANTVTILGFLFGMSGVLFGYLMSLKYLLIGFILFLVLDFVDGNVAKARGGGTFLGSILDMASDRAILFGSVYTLTNYHIENSQFGVSKLLLLYMMFFIFLDILQLAFVRGRKSMSAYEQTEEEGKKILNNFNTIFSDPVIWIPSRLSSYLLIVILLLSTGSFQLSYLVGLICVAGEFVTMIIKHGKSMTT